MEIYPTNKSISYKILKKINNRLFKCNPPENLYCYVGLCLLYATISIIGALNVMVFGVTILSLLTEDYVSTLLQMFNPFLTVSGVLLGLFTVGVGYLMIYTTLYIGLPITLLLVIFNYKKISFESVGEFLESIKEVCIDILHSTVDYLYEVYEYCASIKLPEWLKKKIDFRDE